jgi:hypothetical protein
MYRDDVKYEGCIVIPPLLVDGDGVRDMTMDAGVESRYIILQILQFYWQLFAH